MSDKITIDLYKAMTKKQQKFAEAYLSNGYNKKQAAISAGYSKNGARVTGHQVLQNPNVKTYVDTILNEVIEPGIEALKKKVLEELQSIGFSDIRDILNDSGEIDLSHIDSINTRAIKSIQTDVGKNRQGEEITKIRVTYHDKIKTLELLSKYLGILTEKHEVTIDGDLPVNINIISTPA